MKILLMPVRLFVGIVFVGFHDPMWKQYETTLDPWGSSVSNFFWNFLSVLGSM